MPTSTSQHYTIDVYVDTERPTSTSQIEVHVNIDMGFEINVNFQ